MQDNSKSATLSCRNITRKTVTGAGTKVAFIPQVIWSETHHHVFREPSLTDVDNEQARKDKFFTSIRSQSDSCIYFLCLIKKCSFITHSSMKGHLIMREPKDTATCDHIYIMHQASFLLTYAAGRCSWPGAIGLAQSDAGSLEVKIWLASHSTGRFKVVVAYVLDEEAIFWRWQCWAVYHWWKRQEERRERCEILTFHIL